MPQGAPVAEEDADLILAPGVRRLRPDDHFMIVAETDASPMHIGAFLVFDAPRPDAFVSMMRTQMRERLAATPLLCRLAQSPEGYDSDVWVDVADCDWDYHFAPVSLAGATAEDVNAFIAERSMERLDLTRPPFRVHALTGWADGRCGLYLKTHHSVADGIGFQSILGLLSDEAPPSPPRSAGGVAPNAMAWRALAEARFARLEARAAAHKQARRAAKAGLDQWLAAGSHDRAPTPTLKMSGPTSTRRAYAPVSLPLAAAKACAAKFDATVNDIFLATIAEALRNYLLEIDDLPSTPIVVNSARSYRRPEHGLFGNRIVAMHPHLGVNIADPVARLRAIQGEMVRERGRAAFDEAMLDAPEQPYGARDRRARFSERLSEGARMLPGNVTVSNVPGRAGALRFSGFEMRANHPAPIIGSGRFMNITSRRNADRLDLGVMTDAEKIPSAQRIADLLVQALALYQHAAP